MSHRGPWILGLASSAHNGAACLLRGSEIVVAIQEERLSRLKRARLSASVPSLAIPYCLDVAGITAQDLDLVVTCGLQDLNGPRHQADRNPQLARASCPKLQISHHLGHAVSVFATSGLDHAAVLVVDGAGSLLDDLNPAERAVATVSPELIGAPEICEAHSLYEIRQGTITPIEKQMGWWMTEDQTKPGMKAFASLGGMYSAVGEQIFGDPLNGPGKVMGLSPFGTATIAADRFFDFSVPLVAPKTDVTLEFGFDDRWPKHRTLYENLAASAQAALEQALLQLVRRLKLLVPADHLCYAGGVALNSVANERIRREGGFRDEFILPAAEDSGTAIGAAFYGLWQLEPIRSPRLQSDGLGRSYSREETLHAARNVPAITWTEPPDVISETVDLLTAEKFIGWFQGRAELGPRALGQRSILCDARSAPMKDLLNARIKHREGFRPFAPLVLAEEAAAWFEVEPHTESPFMLHVWPFRREVMDRVPAVVHCDGTGRVQTVTSQSNAKLHALLKEYFRRTGVPMILNTSLNVAGEPIVETPEDALWCLLETELDACVVGDVVVRKQIGYGTALDLLVTASPSTTIVGNEVSIETPWGSVTRALSPVAMKVLRHLAEPITGHDLLEQPEIASEVDQFGLVRTLATLRSARLIQMTSPS